LKVGAFASFDLEFTLVSPESESEHTNDEKPTRTEASEQWVAHVTKEFNSEVKYAIDGAIFSLVGGGVLAALYKNLKEHYDITPDEIPYRLDSVFETLEHTFGVKGARTLSRVVARRLYFRLNLQFVEKENYRLQDYLEDAKKKLKLKKE